ncbi:membrane protein [Klebsiella variicola]|uniref:Membrane protein n=1 Tax=Klebsiella variicola TaxID=244366 RepID=A0A7H4MP77_KLEVA|nr:membrane protein [Klebsiella variicola]
MADIFYPDEYLPMPLMDGYGFKPISPLLRTEMTSGRAQQRKAIYLNTHPGIG